MGIVVIIKVDATRIYAPIVRFGDWFGCFHYCLAGPNIIRLVFEEYQRAENGHGMVFLYSVMI